jgi:hypothetical protein
VKAGDPSRYIEKSIFSAIISCMALDIEDRLDHIEETLEENNKLLRKIRRKEVFNFWFNVIKILIFVGVFYYGYLFIQPYLEQLFEVYTSIKETADTAGQIKDSLNVGVQGFDISKIFNGLTE